MKLELLRPDYLFDTENQFQATALFVEKSAASSGLASTATAVEWRGGAFGSQLCACRYTSSCDLYSCCWPLIPRHMSNILSWWVKKKGKCGEIVDIRHCLHVNDSSTLVLRFILGLSCFGKFPIEAAGAINRFRVSLRRMYYNEKLQGASDDDALRTVHDQANELELMALTPLAHHLANLFDTYVTSAKEWERLSSEEFWIHALLSALIYRNAYIG